jgi:hypothetical protein
MNKSLLFSGFVVLVFICTTLSVGQIDFQPGNSQVSVPPPSLVGTSQEVQPNPIPSVVTAVDSDTNSLSSCLRVPPSGCQHNYSGDWCADPIQLTGRSWSGHFDLCDYCNDYNLEPCTHYPSDAKDMVFRVRLLSDENSLYAIVYPSTQWDIALAISFRCDNYDSIYCIAGSDEFIAGCPESCSLGGMPPGVYFIAVSGYIQDCGSFDIYVYSNTWLPVELVSFEGFAGNREAKLMWTTASETNNDHFYLLRSNDHLNFARATSNIPATNSPTGSTYSYVDGNLVNGTTYYYKLVNVDINGLESVNGLVANVTPTQNSNITPDAYSLRQNYPNPFNPNTSISYDIREAGHVTLAVFDVLGREVASLVNDNQTAGSYTVEFNASKLSSGIYFYQLKTNDFTDMKKMVVMK